eukprot:1671084-Pyramimonas_sp.AAC.1
MPAPAWEKLPKDCTRAAGSARALRLSSATAASAFRYSAGLGRCASYPARRYPHVVIRFGAEQGLTRARALL